MELPNQVTMPNGDLAEVTVLRARTNVGLAEYRVGDVQLTLQDGSTEYHSRSEFLSKFQPKTVW